MGMSMLSEERGETEMYMDDTDLEWLSLNWRKFRAQKMSKSNRRMILQMFEIDY